MYFLFPVTRMASNFLSKIYWRYQSSRILWQKHKPLSNRFGAPYCSTLAFENSSFNTTNNIEASFYPSSHVGELNIALFGLSLKAKTLSNVTHTSSVIYL